MVVNGKILIANRDMEMASIISHELMGEASEVITIGDGQKLLSKIKSDDFQLLVMDFIFPELSGSALLTEISNLNSFWTTAR